MKRIRKASEERAAALERAERQANRNKPYPTTLTPFPVGSDIQTLYGDSKDKRICVVMNENGYFLKSLATPSYPAMWSRLEDALKFNSPTRAYYVAEKYGGTVKHYHEKQVFEVNFYAGIPLPKLGYVEVI